MRSVLSFAVISMVTAFAFAQVKIETPIRGWRISEDKADAVQQVHYPASNVNTLGKKGSSQMIRGRIGANSKTHDPLKLIINGLDMPLRANGDSFARPFAFASKSNSVEIRSGKDRHAVQFYEAKETLTPARLRVLLSWDSDGTDLDLHLVTPDGEHCFYGARLLPSGTALDIDVTDGYGPEIISVPSPKNGTYLVYVNYYGSGKSGDELTTAKVSIVSHAGTSDEKIESSLVPMRSPGEVTLVKSFKYP